LKPLSQKQLLKEYSAKQEDPGLVEDIILYYWETLRKVMSNKEHFNIDIRGFGHFLVNEKKLTQELAKSHTHIQSLNLKEFKSFARYEGAVAKHKQLANLKDMIVQENKRMYTFKTNKNAKKNQENLDKQVGDSGGIL
jgi:hypothetical protein